MLDTKNDIKGKNCTLKLCFLITIYFLIYMINDLFICVGSMQQLENRTEKLEYTIKKLMNVAKELKESKKTLDNISAKQLMKLSKR